MNMIICFKYLVVLYVLFFLLFVIMWMFFLDLVLFGWVVGFMLDVVFISRCLVVLYVGVVVMFFFV